MNKRALTVGIIGVLVGSTITWGGLKLISLRSDQRSTQIERSTSDADLSSRFILLADLISKVEDEVKSSPTKQLSPSLVQRLGIISQKVTKEPFHYFQEDTLENSKSSFARAWLLQSLVTLGIDSTSFSAIKSVCTFAGADLRDAQLEGLSFKGINLTKANLSGANLNYTDLSYADLRSCNLKGCKLEGANLSFAKLNRAKLDWANLQGANLHMADLRGAYLRNADARHANFSCAQVSLLKANSINLANANCQGLSMYLGDLSEAILQEADLSWSSIYNSNLQGAVLLQADLYAINFRDSEVKEPDWINQLIKWGVVGVEEIKADYEITEGKPDKAPYLISKKVLNR